MAVRKINGSYFVLPDEQAPDRPVKMPLEHRAPITAQELLALVEKLDHAETAIDEAIVSIAGMNEVHRMSTHDRDRLHAARSVLTAARHALALARGGHTCTMPSECTPERCK